MCDLKKSLCSMLMACCLIGGLATAFAPTPLLAQSVSGEITGSVTDPTVQSEFQAYLDQVAKVEERVAACDESDRRASSDRSC